jgi:hypothetical protein
MKVKQARRSKDLERESTGLKRAEAVLTLDKLILNEALEANYSASPGTVSVLHICKKAEVQRD